MTLERSTGQPLWCEACHRLHRFTAGDLELIIYVAQAHVGVTETGPDESLSRGEEFRVDCLLTFLTMATDEEVYGEHVESLVYERQRAVKLDIGRVSGVSDPFEISRSER